MAEQTFSIDIVKVPKSDAERGQIRALALKRGWGVFENIDGIACLPQSTLRSVWSGEEIAKVEADILNNSEGVMELEVESDPESNVYRQVYFNTGRVALTGVEPAIVAHATYERVED